MFPLSGSPTDLKVGWAIFPYSSVCPWLQQCFVLFAWWSCCSVFHWIEQEGSDNPVWSTNPRPWQCFVCCLVVQCYTSVPSQCFALHPSSKRSLTSRALKPSVCGSPILGLGGSKPRNIFLSLALHKTSHPHHNLGSRSYETSKTQSKTLHHLSLFYCIIHPESSF